MDLSQPSLEVLLGGWGVGEPASTPLQALFHKAVGLPYCGDSLAFFSDVDYVTPLCSQVVYEGLVDDTFRIKCGKCPIVSPGCCLATGLFAKGPAAPKAPAGLILGMTPWVAGECRG